MADSRFTYSRWPAKAKGDADESHQIHSVASNRNNGGFGLKSFLLRFLVSGYAFFFLLLHLLLLLLKGSSILAVLWSSLVVSGGLVLTLLLSKTVEKESVLLVPGFGVQLQTHYLGGKVIRRFIPIDKILKPVLVERVTPLTCYWSLALLVREEAELTPVFKDLRPPVKMLVPIWEALFAAANSEEKSAKVSV